MKLKILTILLMVSLAFNLGILVKVVFKSTPAEPAQKAACIQYHWKDSHICRQLNLSGQQVQQMEKYREQFQDRISPLQLELEKERLKLFQVLKQETLVQGEADKILRQISHLQTEIQKSFIQHFFQIKGIFDKDQQEQFYSYLGQCLCVEKLVAPCVENSCAERQGHVGKKQGEGR
jgi:Spy/CpxP family protein refolding chaperone